MTKAQLAIRARGLRRVFDDVLAVDAVDLDVQPGAIFGLLGPDGVGKSTLIRMLATTLVPTAGSAAIFGLSVTDQRDDLTPRIGYMSQRFSMYPDLSVAENLEFFATIRGVPKTSRLERSAALLTAMGLAEFSDRQAAHLSGGMKQKLMLATTLMHSPELLLLDEPTTGVDPVSRREFWRILADLHDEGKTILVATPYMDEAERCTEIAFMEAGRIQQTGSLAEIKQQVPGRLIELRTPDSHSAAAALAGLGGVSSAHPLGDTVRVLWEGQGDFKTPLTTALEAVGIAATVIREIPIDMETVFTYLAKTKPRQEAAA